MKTVTVLMSIAVLLRSAQADRLSDLVEQMRQRTETGDYSAAGRLLPALLDELDKPHPRASSGWNQVGVYHHTQRNYSEAESAYQRGIGLMEKQDGSAGDHALLLLNLATLYLEMGGRPAQAEILCRRALLLAEQLHGGRSPVLANFWYILAATRVQQKDHKQARLYFREALAHVDDSRDAKLRQGFILANLAVLSASEKRWIEARDLLLQSLHITESTLGRMHPDLVGTYLNLASVNRNIGQLKQAYESVTRAREITEASLGPQHPLMIESLRSSARILRKSGRGREARDLLRRADAIAKASPADPAAHSSIHIADLAPSPGPRR